MGCGGPLWGRGVLGRVPCCGRERGEEEKGGNKSHLEPTWSVNVPGSKETAERIVHVTLTMTLNIEVMYVDWTIANYRDSLPTLLSSDPVSVSGAVLLPIRGRNVQLIRGGAEPSAVSSHLNRGAILKCEDNPLSSEGSGAISAHHLVLSSVSRDRWRKHFTLKKGCHHGSGPQRAPPVKETSDKWAWL
ncbi:unnamed protein product [Gadus morhua 'NCC']